MFRIRPGRYPVFWVASYDGKQFLKEGITLVVPKDGSIIEIETLPVAAWASGSWEIVNSQPYQSEMWNLLVERGGEMLKIAFVYP